MVTDRTPDDTQGHIDPFLSLTALRIAHNDLLQAHREHGTTPEIQARTLRLIQRGQAAGALLDIDTDRWAAQSILDYWSAILFRLHLDAPDATLAEFDPSQAPELPDEACPYVGLDAFSESHRDLFYGRERLTKGLIARLAEERFLAVVGPSGSGKSSTAMAGVLPQLRSGALPGSQEWQFLPRIVPGSAPLLNVTQLLASASGQANPSEEWEREQAALICENPAHLVNFINAACQTPVFVVVDQFEEVFTLCSENTTRNAFVTALVELAQKPGLPHRVVITLRTDFESFVARIPTFQPFFEGGLALITPLNAAELREAIEKPAERVGLKLEPGLTDQLLQDVLGEPAALPLLQFTLLKLWENREHNRITWDAYRRLGSGRVALACSADAFYESLIPEEQITVRRIFVRLVRPGEGLEFTSNRVLRETLYKTGEARDRIDRVLAKLISARLVRLTEGDVAVDAQVEIAHEALVRNWPFLVNWLEEERGILRQRQRLSDAALHWQALGRDSGALLRLALLDEAKRVVEISGYQLSELEMQFLQASEQAIENERQMEIARQIELEKARLKANTERQRADEQARVAHLLRRRAVYLALALSVALAAAVLAGLSMVRATRAEQSTDRARQAAQAEANARATEVAVRKQAEETALNQTRLARTEQLAAESENALERTPQRSLLLAVEALSVTRSFDVARVPAAEEALRHALANSQSHILLTPDAGAFTIAVSPDSRTVYSYDSLGALRWWDLTAPDPASSERGLAAQTTTVTTIQISPDGHWLAGYGNDSAVHLWNIQTTEPRPAGTLDEHAGRVHDVVFSSDGRWLLTANDDQTVRLWDLSLADPSSGSRVLSGHTGAVTSVALSPDDRWLATGSLDLTVRLWDLAVENLGGKPIVLAGQSRRVTDLAFSPDGRWLVAASLGDSAHLWKISPDGSSGRQFDLTGHGKWIGKVVFSPNSEWLATTSDDRVVRMWDLTLSDPSDLSIPLRGHSDSINVITFSPDSRFLITGGRDNTVRRWDLTAPDPAAAPIILRGHDRPIWQLIVTPDGRRIVTGSGDHSIRVWDLGKLGQSVDPVVWLEDLGRSISHVLITSDDRWLIAAGEDSAVRVWELGQSNLLSSPRLLKGHTSSVRALAVSPDARWLAIGSDDQTVRLWELAGDLKDPTAVLVGHQAPINSVAFSSDSRLLASGGRDGIVLVWAAAAGVTTADLVFEGHEGSVSAVAFTRDGEYIVSASDDGTARLWAQDTTGSAPRSIMLRGHSGAVQTLSISGDNHWLATGGTDATIRLWDLTQDLTQVDQTPALFVLRGHAQSIRATAFSPDSHWLASGSEDNTLRLWDLTAADPSKASSAIQNHEENVTNLSFAADSRRLVSTSEDTLVRLFELGDHGAISDPVTLQGHSASVTSVAVNHGGNWLATGSTDGTVRLWMLDINHLVELACSTAGRNLAQHEWVEFMHDLPYHKTCPKSPTHFTWLAFYRDQALILAQQGDIEGAMLQLELVDDLGGESRNDLAVWQSLCWQGSMWGKPAQVIAACDWAVSLAPGDGTTHQARAVARAFTGDLPGSADDLRLFVTWAEEHGRPAKAIEIREKWISALDSNENPFDEATLESLKNE